MDEEEGSRMVFFGQLREPELLHSWSAPPLALRDEGQGQQVQQKMRRMTMKIILPRANRRVLKTLRNKKGKIIAADICMSTNCVIHLFNRISAGHLQDKHR